MSMLTASKLAKFIADRDKSCSNFSGNMRLTTIRQCENNHHRSRYRT